MNERFSAFLDNETTRDESDAVVGELLRDEKLRGSWSRQHRIRDTLRASHGEAMITVDVDFAARVMRAIEAEPAHAASASLRAHDVVEPTRENVVSLPRKRRHRWRNAAGFAVAASAAGFALFVTQPLQRLDGIMPASVAGNAASQQTLASAGSNTTPGLSFETVAATGAANAANTDTGGFADFDIPWNLGDSLAQRLASGVDQAQAAVDHWSVSNPTLANRLNKLLFEHNGMARGYGLGATTPAFVRVATYGQDLPR